MTSVSDDMRRQAMVACSKALTAPLAAVATMPSRAQRSRPASTFEDAFGQQRAAPAPTQPKAGHVTTASQAEPQPEERAGRPLVGGRAAGQTAEMRSTAASVKPPSANPPMTATLAASTAYTPKSAGPSARAITSEATSPSPSRTTPAEVTTAHPRVTGSIQRAA